MTPDIERLRALAASFLEGHLDPEVTGIRMMMFKSACDPQAIIGLIDAASKAEELQAEVERLEKDAERLDYIDSHAATQNPPGPLRTWLWARPFGSNGLRKMIDSAMAISKPATEAKP